MSDGIDLRADLDQLIRQIQQATARQWPADGGDGTPEVPHSPRLASALAAGIAANDTGIYVDIGPALEELQAAWAAEGS